MRIETWGQSEWEWCGHVGEERLWVCYGVPEYRRGEVATLAPLYCGDYLEAIEVVAVGEEPLCPSDVLTPDHYAAIEEAWTERRENL